MVLSIKQAEPYSRQANPEIAVFTRFINRKKDHLILCIVSAVRSIYWIFTIYHRCSLNLILLFRRKCRIQEGRIQPVAKNAGFPAF